MPVVADSGGLEGCVVAIRDAVRGIGAGMALLCTRQLTVHFIHR